MEIYVAFSDESESAITSSFGCAQDLAVWPYQDIVLDTDARWAEYLATLPPDICALLRAKMPA